MQKKLTENISQIPEAFECKGSLALVLDFQFHNGDRWAFPYAYLNSIQFDKSGKITLNFTSHSVEIHGQCLTPVYEALLKHSVTLIRELRPEYYSTNQEKPFVEKITVMALN